MKKWYVGVNVEHIERYEVEAETAQEAEKIVLSGDVDPVKMRDYGWEIVTIEELKMPNEIRVLKEFVNEFSPLHQGQTERMSYTELFDIVEKVVLARMENSQGE